MAGQLYLFVEMATDSPTLTCIKGARKVTVYGSEQTGSRHMLIKVG